MAIFNRKKKVWMFRSCFKESTVNAARGSDRPHPKTSVYHFTHLELNGVVVQRVEQPSSLLLSGRAVVHVCHAFLDLSEHRKCIRLARVLQTQTPRRAGKPFQGASTFLIEHKNLLYTTIKDKIMCFRIPLLMVS